MQLSHPACCNETQTERETKRVYAKKLTENVEIYAHMHAAQQHTNTHVHIRIHHIINPNALCDGMCSDVHGFSTHALLCRVSGELILFENIN